MKKNLLYSIPIALAILLFSMKAFSAPVAPVRTMALAGAYPTPQLDGIAESTYGEVQTTTIFNPTGYDDPSDFTTVFQLCYDYDYLYVLATITDDVDHSYNWGVGNSWEFDNIELFFQLDTNTVTTSYNATTVQLRINRGLDSVETPGRAKRSDYKYYMEGAAAGGWITEVAIPWTAVLAEGSVPEDIQDYFRSVVGFDFLAADSDNSDGDAAVGNRNVQSAWDMDDPDGADDRTEDLAWNNTSVFGYVYFWSGDNLDNFSQSPTNSLSCYPNPATETIRLLNIDQPGAVAIYSIDGAVVLSSEYQAGQELDVSGLKSGMYTVVVDGMNSGRFVKN